MQNSELMDLAIQAAQNSYSPYSKFKVGAALLCADDTVFLGCNVENVSFGATNCAERTAIFSAVAGSKREFTRIAIVGISPDGITEQTQPCGICRQVLSQFCGDTFEILLTDGKEIFVYTLSDFFPFPFDKF